MVALEKQSVVVMDCHLGGDRSGSPSTHSEAQSPVKNANEQNQGVVEDATSVDEIDELLRKVAKFLCINGQKLAEYQDVRFSSNDKGENLIHLILGGLIDNHGDSKPPRQEALECVKELVLEKPELLTMDNRSLDSPLYQVSENHLVILFAILELLVPHRVAKAITTTCDRNSAQCPLWNVHKGRLEQCTKKSSTKTPEDSSVADNSKGDSLHKKLGSDVSGQEEGIGCLHCVVDFKEVLQKDQKLREELKKELHKDKKSCLEAILNEEHLNLKKGTAKMLADGLPLFLEVMDNSVFTKSDHKGYIPLHRAIKLYQSMNNIAYESLALVIEALVQRFPDAIYHKTESLNKNDNGKMALGLLQNIQQCTKGDSRPQPIERTVAIKRTENLLKQTCLGSSKKSWDEMKEFLYSGQVRSGEAIKFTVALLFY